MSAAAVSPSSIPLSLLSPPSPKASRISSTSSLRSSSTSSNSSIPSSSSSQGLGPSAMTAVVDALRRQRTRCLCPLATHPSPPPSRMETDSKKRAIIICKRTRWEYEAAKLSSGGRRVDDALVEKVLRERDIDTASLKDKHDAQKRAEQRITNELKKHGLSVLRVSLSSLPSTLPPSAMVITAGGDGTFLAAASLVADGTPVIGINTDPQGSEGHLCVGGKTPPANLVDLVITNEPQWMRRSRIRVSFSGQKRKEVKPLLALNEVFVGEVDAAKVSYYEISVNGGPPQKQKSSGIIICTGSGSSAWYKSINRVQTSTVQSVFDTLRSLGIALPDQDERLADTVAERMNDRLTEAPDCPELLFSVREAIFNKTFLPSPTKGRAVKITLKSRSSQAVVVLDGSRQINWEYGSELTLEIDPSFALNTLL